MKAINLIKEIQKIQNIYGQDVEIVCDRELNIDSEIFTEITFIRNTTDVEFTESAMRKHQIVYSYSDEDIAELFAIVVKL